MASKSNATAKKPAAAAQRVKKQVEAAPTLYLPPSDPEMVKLGSDELLIHAEKGAAQAQQAGLELLRRKRNRTLKKAGLPAGVSVTTVPASV